MKARFSLLLLVVTLSTFIVIQMLSQAETAVARQGTAVTETEAVQALAHGRLLAANSANQPVGGSESLVDASGRIPQPDFLSISTELTGTIAFASDRSGPFSVYAQNVVGDTAVPLVSGPSNNATPVWSPDGTKLVFASDRDSNFEIYVRLADGTEQRLTNHSADDFHPSWSPDGTLILFTSNRGGGYYQAYTMNQDGSNVQQVGVIANNVLYPRFSPDGSRIAFMRASIPIPACDWNWDIWVMDSTGGNQLGVTTNLGGDLYPNWTPDGRIIYASCRNFFSSNLYIVDPDSGAETQVTDWSGNELHGVYSPDEAHLAFNATLDGNYEIYIRTWADGTTFNLSQNPADDLTPDWDGQRIGPCTGANPSLQPVLLAPGWGAADTITDDNSGFKQMLPYLQNMGYRLGCNLFYAGETAANLDLYENAEVIRDDVCQAYAAIKEFNNAWNGRMDIIGHSFGGLRARAFLEDYRWYDGWGMNGVYCQPPYELPANEKLFVDNLFTLGSPHGGGTADLPGALFIGVLHLNPDDWASVLELLFVMPTFNELHEQPEGVCYRFVSGNAWEQQETHDWLGWLYSSTQEETPNDLGVYRWSVYAPPDNWPDQYDRVVRYDTIDMHGYFGLLAFIQSYVHPANTFDAVIKNILNHTETPCPANQPGSLRPAYPTEAPAIPMLVQAVDTITSGATVSGDFQLVEGGAATIYLDWPYDNLVLTLTDPAGNVWTPETAEGDPNADYLEMTVLSNVTAYVFTDTITGTWSYTITAGALSTEMPYRLVALPEREIMATAVATAWQPAGQPITITSTVQLADATPLLGVSLEAHISRPDGVVDVLSLFDDGAHQDGAANDGVYGNSYSTALHGRYVATVRANGTYEGQAYTRTADTLFTLAPHSAALSGQYSEQPQDDDGDGFYDWLDMTAGLAVNTDGTYQLAADLMTLEGEFVAHALAQADLAAGSAQLTLSFSGQAIAASGQDGPYWVSNVLLVDTDRGTVVVDRAENVYQTAAYDHTQFGTPPSIYLPIVIRR